MFEYLAGLYLAVMEEAMVSPWLLMAVFCGVLGTTRYTWEIFFGSTRPSAVTYGIWSLLAFSTLASAYASGAKSTLPLLALVFVESFWFFVLAVIYGIHDKRQAVKRNQPKTSDEILDKKREAAVAYLCLIGTVIGIIPWWLWDAPIVTLMLDVILSVIGGIPTVAKVLYRPETEDGPSWAFALMGQAITMIVSLMAWQAAELVYSTAMVALDGAIVWLIYIAVHTRATLKEHFHQSKIVYWLDGFARWWDSTFSRHSPLPMS